MDALAEDPGSISSTHMSARNHLKLQSQENLVPSSGLDGHQAYKWCTDMHAGKALIPTYKIITTMKQNRVENSPVLD